MIEIRCRLMGIFGQGGMGKAFGYITFIIVVSIDRDKL